MKVRLRALQEQMAQSRERDAAITRDLDRLGLQLERLKAEMSPPAKVIKFRGGKNGKK
jgi:hypothetical protein